MSFEEYMKAKHKGRSNAIKSQQLEKIFQCKGVQIREKVNDLRSRGVPICSCSKGYYYSELVEDIKETIMHLNSRIKKITVAENGLRRTLKDRANIND